MLSSINYDFVKTVWHKPFFDASRSRLSDEEYSAQFFRLLLCQILRDREETWSFIKQDVIEEKITVSFDDLKNKFGR